MILKYHNYEFPAGLQTFSYEITPNFGDLPQRETETHVVRIRGELILPSSIGETAAPAELQKLIDKIKSAFTTDGRDFSVTFPNGVKHIDLRSADFSGGLRITKGPNFIGEGRGELVRRRSFELEITGEKIIEVIGGVGGITSNVTFTESLSFRGNGGQRFVLIETMHGEPIKQVVNERTICRCVQSGSATRRGQNPIVPNAIFPDAEKQDERQIEFSNPGKDLYGASWSYVFESATALQGFPNR